MSYVWRSPTASDHAEIAPLVDQWWGGRAVQQMLPRLFFTHFSGTSLVVLAADGGYVGFVVAFASQDVAHHGYIHFVGVHPQHRGAGLGAELYQRTFETLRARRCTQVSAVTSPVNSGSIAFHARLGFQWVPAPADQPPDTRETVNTVDARAVWRDYDGPGEDRVVFKRSL